MSFSYKHDQKLTINTELGPIELTYVDVNEVEEDAFGMKDLPGDLVEDADTYWVAFLASKNIFGSGVIAQKAVEEVYRIEALQRFRNLKLDLPV